MIELKLKIKPKKLNPMCLQPIVGPLGLSSKDIVKEIDLKLKSIEIEFYKHYYFILKIDVFQKKYELVEILQPDSRVLTFYALRDELNKDTIEAYAKKTLGNTYANDVESRIKELNAIIKSCKLKWR